MNFKEQLMPYLSEIKCGYIQYLNRRDDLPENYTIKQRNEFINSCNFDYDTLGIELIPVKEAIIWLQKGWLTFEDRKGGAISEYKWHFNAAPVVPDYLINNNHND